MDDALNSQSTDIAAIVEANPVSVLTDEKTYADFYRHVEEEIKAFAPDLSTVTSRKAIASLSYKITRTKTAIDNAGKALTDEWRKNTNKVNEKRRKAREEFEALAIRARQPLTEWEEAEEQRVNAAGDFFDHISDCKTLERDADSDTIKLKLNRLTEVVLDEAVLLERSEEGNAALTNAREFLMQALAAAEKAEADARELARLRAENEARVQAEREAAAKAEAERLAKEVAERAEAETKRREEEAAKRARDEEKRLADEAIAKAEREKLEAIAKAEAEKQALILEQERKESERKAEEAHAAAAQAKREANKRHRTKLIKEAEAAISQFSAEPINEAVGNVIPLGLPDRIAERVVAAIIDGKIPHIEMKF